MVHRNHAERQIPQFPFAARFAAGAREARFRVSAPGCKLPSVSMYFALQRQAWAPLGCAPHPEPPRRPMIRKVLMAAFVLVLSISAIAQSASAQTIVAGADLKKVVPDTYFFRGMSATTQLRNSSAIRYPDDLYVIIGLVDTSGYSSDIKAKYIGLFITEKKLSFDGGGALAPGQYGMGYTADGKFHILNVAGDELLVTSIKIDDKLARPQPLKIVLEGTAAKLYLGKKFVSFTTAQ